MKNRIFQSKIIIKWIGIGVIVIGVLSLFVYLNQRMESLERKVIQITSKKEKILEEMPEKKTSSEKAVPREIRSIGEKGEIPSFKELQKIPKGNWKEVVTFKGKKNQTTNSFFVPISWWRINFEIETFPGRPGSLAYTVYRTEDDHPVAGGSFAPEKGQDYGFALRYISWGKTKFYIIISPVNLKSWKAKVETL